MLSAGTKPSGDINPLAIKVMKEVGIDISNQKSKDITEDMMRNSAKIWVVWISHFVQRYLSPI
jgi:arsenate reductase (thioredoxin)